MLQALRGSCVFVSVVLVATVIFITGCSTPDSNITDGKRWYRMHNCFACHGENGHDGGGPDIAGLDMSYRSFVRRLRNSETAVMPEFSKEKISDQDAADILSFLHSIK